MSKPAKPIPTGYHSATPGIVVTDATRALEFYQKGLGAKETVRMTGPDGKQIMHAEIKIGDSTIFVGDEVPEMATKAPTTLGGTTGTIHLYVPDVDKAFQQAVAAGAKPVSPPTDMFWGDRYAQITDPFGHNWGLATHKEDPTTEEMHQRAEAFYRQRASQPKP